MKIKKKNNHIIENGYIIFSVWKGFFYKFWCSGKFVILRWEMGILLHRHRADKYLKCSVQSLQFSGSDERKKESGEWQWRKTMMNRRFRAPSRG